MIFADFKKITLTIVMFISMLTLIAACGDVISPSSTPQDYSGPGSKWDVNLAADDTFTITRRASVNAATDLTVEGSYSTLTTGFVELMVTTATGTGSPAAGDQAVALEIPGYAFILMPIDPASDQLIAMNASGECPTTNMTGNWVIVNGEDGRDATSSTQDYFGTFAFDVTSGTGSLPSMYALGGSFAPLAPGSIDPGTCANGIMDLTTAVMYLTSNGGAIVHLGADTATDADDDVIFVLAPKAITAVSNLDGSYAGILFDDNNAAGSKTSPVSMSCKNAACIASIVSDISTGATTGESVTMTLSGPDMPSNGFITGMIADTGSTPGNLACMVDIDVLNTGKKIISCVGQSPGMNSKMFNVIFTSI